MLTEKNSLVKIKKSENYPGELLILAALNNDLGNVELLISTGSDINSKDEDGNTALMHATREGNFKIFNFLLNNEKLNINKKNKNGATALLIAAEEHDSDLVDLLLNQKADPNIKDNNGWTALLKFLEPYFDDCNVDTVKNFLFHGADVNAENKEKTTALMLAAQVIQPELLSAILSYKPNIDAIDKNGHTAFDYSSEYGSTEITDLLEAADPKKRP